ncbi:hypothetical protein J2Z21_004971 [Streptomyces griseochromogenes]|uniref:DUF397 domain-containing protein n=1 Tax=Streptomyces griseochromogenes TaxID=68214 RepID=A0A1B1ASN9_9ACTN|nr:DUF397 domain-containing protein [Streptomyces griseochromogenes]ANP49561.1 DUF397 domain-containing protein [Streptomyces griseochromogenes]MBP2051994.1 hypothetical protein [Streptomyces griseochromogenes]
MPEFEFSKSSYSHVENDCVEVARNIPNTVAVRDSKTPRGPILRLTPKVWARFTASLA